MSGSKKESRGGSFGLSSPELSDEQRRRGMQNNKDGPITLKRQDSSPSIQVSRPDQHNQSYSEPGNKQTTREIEEHQQKNAALIEQTATSEGCSIKLSIALFLERLERSSSPRHAFAYQQQHQPQQHPNKSEGVTRTFAARGHGTNEMEPGPSYSHYPTSDTRTDGGEVSHETKLLTGPGFNSRPLSARGRIWETETCDNGWKNEKWPRNRELGLELASSTSTSTSISASTPFASFADSRGKEPLYQSSLSTKIGRTAELIVPASRVREGEEDYSYSYSTTSSIHRSQEASSMARPSNSLPSISRAEENSSTPSVPRVRNKSVSDSPSASAVTNASMYRVPQSQYTSEAFLKRPSSPSNIPGDYRIDGRKQPLSTTSMSLTSRALHEQDVAAPSRLGAFSRMREPDRTSPSGADDLIHHQSRSHVSRSPDRPYFQNTSTRSGNDSIKAAFQGICQPELAKEPANHYSETTSSYSSEPSSSRIRSNEAALPPMYNSTRIGDENVAAERLYSHQGFGVTNLNVERHRPTRRKQNDDSRSYGGSNSSTPPAPESKDRLKQRTYVEYAKPPRQGDFIREVRRSSAQEQERHETAMTDSTQISSAGLFGVLKGVRAQHSLSEPSTNPPSKATSSYSPPLTASASLSPVLSKSLPSLRETFASPRISTEPPRNLSSTTSSSGHLKTVSIPSSQTISSRSTPGGPWLYDGEEPDLEEDEGFALADEGERPKKRRRTRVALSCAECKRRKIKCDRAQPCTPCARRGDQSNCKWAVMETKDGAPTRAEFEALQSRVLQLERHLFSIAPQQKPSP